jgi:hypothetical protein
MDDLLSLFRIIATTITIITMVVIVHVAIGHMDVRFADNRIEWANNKEIVKVL